MPEWLRAAIVDVPAVHWGTLVLRLAAGLILGIIVAGTYLGTRRAANITPSFPATLVLLCVLIAMVTQVFGDNVAAVAVGMSMGAGQSAVALCGMVAVTMAAVLFRDRSATLTSQLPSMVLVVRMALSSDLDAAVLAALRQHADDIELVSASTVRHGSAMDVSYHLRLKPSVTLPQLVADLNRVEGVQSAEIRPEREAD
jgi:energy-coupling factor transporter transmembrane protein EcfT